MCFFFFKQMSAYGLSISYWISDVCSSDLGVIVYQTHDRLETMRVVHRNRKGKEVERVQTLTGAPREIIRTGNQVVCLLPKDRKVTLELPTPKALFPGLTPARVAQISRYYEFRDIGEARIAGRICRGITIEPRDQYRYGYEIWADAETAVPVKVDLIGRGNRVMEQVIDRKSCVEGKRVSVSVEF